VLISEIFFSFQGEGLYIGYPQIFIRFSGCNLACPYCDEPLALNSSKEYSVDMILEEIKPLMKYKPFSISLTGGEPLLQVDALKELIPKLPLPVFLETNGTLASHMAEVADLVTYFSVDFKPGFETEFIDFIDILKDKKNVFVKFIVTKGIHVNELKKIAKIISSFNDEIPLILQPVTPFSGIKEKATMDDILRAYNVLKSSLKTIRVIPQTHKLMNIP
jgi:7-carboxy-7-deazaguanine synthase